MPDSVKVKNLEDKSLSNGHYILHVINAVSPNTVDFQLLKDSSTEEGRVANINYALSCARKMGAQVMTLWEHIS